ncbi:hypothetical protein H9Q70_012424 [Fusarium xylarioides]|nr:hypothetical protein H9Q70_012424 [Fusarium xylarioides]
MEGGLIIREKTRVCKDAFQRCLEIQDLSEDDWIEQKSAEFNWWISGLNADKIGPGSLDSRLMLRPDVRDVVVDLLGGLIMALSKCEDIAEEEDIAENDSLQESSSDSQHLTIGELNRTPSPWSDMSDGTGTEARSSAADESEKAVSDLYQEQKFYIETSIEILIRIHAAIKKSGLKFRNQRADDDLARAEERYQNEKSRLGEHKALYGSDPSISEHERFRRFLTRLVLRNGYKEGLLRSIESNIHRFIIKHGPEVNDHPYLNRQRKLLVVFRAYLYDASRLTPIQRRLINANVVRRNRLIHAGNAEKAQPRTKNDEPQLLQRLPIANEVTPQSQAEKRKLDHPGQVPAAAPSYTPPISRKSFVSQAATGLASNFSITTALVPMKKTKSAATKMSARVATIDYPKCPATKGPFPCPYCPSILSHAYTERTKWRAHVSQDLCAYVCIFENCESPDDMYTSTYEWMSHMAKCHSAMEWVCTECSKNAQKAVENAANHSFKDSWDLKAHILSLHPEMHESEVPLMVQAGNRPIGIQRVACPLCRPGLVSNATGEKDGTPVHPEICVEEIGLVHLEEDEHIATHIHEFSPQAFPWPGETKTQDKSEICSSKSTASTRQAVIIPASGAADPIFEIQNYLHNQTEVIDNLEDPSKKLLSLPTRSKAYFVLDHGIPLDSNNGLFDRLLGLATNKLVSPLTECHPQAPIEARSYLQNPASLYPQTVIECTDVRWAFDNAMQQGVEAAITSMLKLGGNDSKDKRSTSDLTMLRVIQIEENPREKIKELLKNPEYEKGIRELFASQDNQGEKRIVGVITGFITGFVTCTDMAVNKSEENTSAGDLSSKPVPAAATGIPGTTVTAERSSRKVYHSDISGDHKGEVVVACSYLPIFAHVNKAESRPSWIGQWWRGSDSAFSHLQVGDAPMVVESKDG